MTINKVVLRQLQHYREQDKQLPDDIVPYFPVKLSDLVVERFDKLMLRNISVVRRELWHIQLK